MNRTNRRPGARCGFAVGRFTVAVFVVCTGALVSSPTPASESVPATWSAQLRSTAYFYQVEDQSEAETDLLPFYQHFDLSGGRLAGDRLDLRFSGRFASDLGDEGAVTGEEKFYVGYAGLRFDHW